jgi:hypothetical protein
MTEAQTWSEIANYGWRMLMWAAIAYATFYSLRREWWQTPRQCAIAAILYGILPPIGWWLCFYGTPAAGPLAWCYLVLAIFWLWFWVWAFRVEADKIMRPVISKEDLNELLAGEGPVEAGEEED